MVVDDEIDIREMLDIMMKNEGYNTEMAEDGSDFLEKVDRFNPDIVTLDVMMPIHMDEFSKASRKELKLKGRKNWLKKIWTRHASWKS